MPNRFYGPTSPTANEGDEWTNSTTGETKVMQANVWQPQFATVTGPMTINPGGLTLSTGAFTMSAAASQLIPGATSFSVRNNANSADNLLVSDAGAVTTRAGLTVTTGGAAVTGTGTITSASASALAVGRLGATTPALQVDASAATSVTGLKVTAAAAGGGLALAVVGGTNENLTIDAQGSGTVGINATGTGAITLGRATTITTGGLTVTAGGLTISGATPTITMSGTGAATIIGGTTGGAIVNNANSVNNLSWTDGGAFTFRGNITINANGLTMTGSLTMSTAASVIIPGSTSLTFVNNANSANNIIITDAGQAQFARAGIGVGATVSTNNQIWTASQGAATTTLYIGNASINVTSDMRLKRDITDTTIKALETIGKLRVVDYTWNDPSDTAPVNRNSRGRWVGLLAQDMVDVVPWVVNAEDRECATCRKGLPCAKHESFWHVDLDHLSGLFVKGFQEMDGRVSALERLAEGSLVKV